MALLAIFLLSPGSSRARVQLLVQQVNGDVVITGSGSANTTDLALDSTDNDYTNVLTDSQIYAGPDAFGDGSGGGGDVGLWSGITSGPTLFGSDASVAENPSSGSIDTLTGPDGTRANAGSITCTGSFSGTFNVWNSNAGLGQLIVSSTLSISSL